MDRKDFLTSSVLAGLASFGGYPKTNLGKRRTENTGPDVDDRLDQGPFTIDNISSWQVVMTTTPETLRVKNYGMGLVTYVIDEAGPPKKEGESLRRSIENLVALPLGDKIYLRLNWKDLQQNPGELNPSKAWEIALEMSQKYKKNIGFRVMINNPEIPGTSMPAFVADNVPQVKLGTTNKIGLDGKVHYEPRYDHPEFQKAFRAFDGLLADRYGSDPRIEYMDTYMYGFWGEGHTWPFDGNPFPDSYTAEKTFLEMFRTQSEHWPEIPLTTNTQPDVSNVGNDALTEETFRTNNWLRTDTIFIENQQIDTISNRPSWMGATLEVGMSDGKDVLKIGESTFTENEIYHVQDVGANYYSLWNWQSILADKVENYYEQYPEGIDHIARKIGYRICPSWIWFIQKQGHSGIIVGLVNDGIAGVPGALKLTLQTQGGHEVADGYIDPGYPEPTGVRQALLMLPDNLNWKGLRLKAELNVKDRLHDVEWACREPINKDGTITLQQTPGLAG